MRRQILLNKKYCTKEKINNIIFIGTDLPDLCHLDLLETIGELKQNDLILGPSNDGGYWLIAFSEKFISKYLYLPFININWGKNSVLQSTINNFNEVRMKYKLLQRKNDIDNIMDIEHRNKQFV